MSEIGGKKSSCLSMEVMAYILGVVLILINLGKEPVRIERGMRIAQMVIAAVTIMAPVEADDIDETARAAGGFGSTGL